jgi:hypothetical protein
MEWTPRRENCVRDRTPRCILYCEPAGNCNAYVTIDSPRFVPAGNPRRGMDRRASNGAGRQDGISPSGDFLPGNAGAARISGCAAGGGSVLSLSESAPALRRAMVLATAAQHHPSQPFAALSVMMTLLILAVLSLVAALAVGVLACSKHATAPSAPKRRAAAGRLPQFVCKDRRLAGPTNLERSRWPRSRVRNPAFRAVVVGTFHRTEGHLRRQPPMHNGGNEMNSSQARAGPCHRSSCAEFCRFASAFRALGMDCGQGPPRFLKCPGGHMLRRHTWTRPAESAFLAAIRT